MNFSTEEPKNLTYRDLDHEIRPYFMARIINSIDSKKPEDRILHHEFFEDLNGVYADNSPNRKVFHLLSKLFLLEESLLTIGDKDGLYKPTLEYFNRVRGELEKSLQSASLGQIKEHFISKCNLLKQLDSEMPGSEKINSFSFLIIFSKRINLVGMFGLIDVKSMAQKFKEDGLPKEYESKLALAQATGFYEPRIEGPQNNLVLKVRYTRGIYSTGQVYLTEPGGKKYFRISVATKNDPEIFVDSAGKKYKYDNHELLEDSDSNKNEGQDVSNKSQNVPVVAKVARWKSFVNSVRSAFKPDEKGFKDIIVELAKSGGFVEETTEDTVPGNDTVSDQDFYSLPYSLSLYSKFHTWKNRIALGLTLGMAVLAGVKIVQSSTGSVAEKNPTLRDMGRVGAFVSRPPIDSNKIVTLDTSCDSLMTDSVAVLDSSHFDTTTHNVSASEKLPIEMLQENFENINTRAFQVDTISSVGDSAVNKINSQDSIQIIEAIPTSPDTFDHFDNSVLFEKVVPAAVKSDTVFGKIKSWFLPKK